MSKKPLCLAILWHMHQPDYGNVQTGDIYLPWTRFHAVKDYYDMAALAAAVPGLRLTINVVPSLMDQLEAYGQGRVRETYADLTLKNASELDERDRRFLLRTFFQLPWERMLDPYPRYRELVEKRGNVDGRGEYPQGLKRYTVRDYRDLQTWFNLAWCGSSLSRKPSIAALVAKGKTFTEEDKQILLNEQTAFIAEILPYYRSLQDSSRIELSVSPYYHPILPLLCDSRSAREAMPGVALPRNPFSYPQDAREHIRRARARYRETFGREAAGMWPSEGSISDAALQFAREAGFRWLASDEGVLANSLRKNGRDPEALPGTWKFVAWRWGDREDGPCLFFRDHGLSDLIGFTYAKWKADRAADDFLRRLRDIHAAMPDDGRHYLVPVILDGENAWEHYHGNGSEFLDRLYRQVVDSGFVRTVTFSEYLDLEPHRESLRSVLAGSWIYSTFSTWLGHPEKNRAWEVLSAARSFLQSCESSDPAAREASFREMMIAEGSDWMWWYGDDHPTQNAVEFDQLFRGHVKNVYRILGEIYPADLDIPIKKADIRTHFRNPVHTITPVIDGRVTDYFEWLSAGFAVPAGGESMHRSHQFLEKIYFGYDNESFYLRIDPSNRKGGGLPAAARVQLQFIAPNEHRVVLERLADREWRCRQPGSSPEAPPATFAAGRVIELAVPFASVGLPGNGEARFAITVLEGDHELERFPSSGFLAVPVDPEGLDLQEWMV
jgi:alpha-amylase/alpha-mannosidase (GH57 family)